MHNAHREPTKAADEEHMVPIIAGRAVSVLQIARVAEDAQGYHLVIILEWVDDLSWAP